MRKFLFLISIVSLISCKDTATTEKLTATDTEKETAHANPLIMEGEKHFKDMYQVTFGGDNAEAYWSFDDQQLIFQSNYADWEVGCDQMFLMNNGDSFRESVPKMVSTGKGRTTCAYFLPDNQHIIYASTHLEMEECPDTPLKENGKYVWPIYDSYDIFVADLEGNITAQLTNEKGYDAEPTVSPQGDKIVLPVIAVVI